MEYNTDKERLVLPEYGRHIQNMVDYAVSLPVRAERQRCAETIVRIMARQFPSERDVQDFERMLWDHIARMSHYRLDVDYPFDITPEEEVAAKPQPVAYPMTHIRYRHYGHLLEELLQKASEMEKGPERDQLIELAANQMRKDLFYWNKDSLNEQKIAADIALFTDGAIQVGDGEIRYHKTVPNNNFQKSRKGRSRKGGN